MGRFFWRQGYFVPLFNQQGTVDYGIVFIIDITEQMRTEKKMRRGLEKFQLLFEKSPGPILVLKVDYIVAANVAWKKMIGGDKKEFLGKSIWEISPELQEGGIFSGKLAEKNI